VWAGPALLFIRAFKMKLRWLAQQRPGGSGATFGRRKFRRLICLISINSN
jgi:hypothetical protein